ncbi:MAG TPA: DUF4861 domain-containing protein [Clostridia bacterium]|nr:DUF4861 domain-containing protein [Clostridia bacterium]
MAAAPPAATVTVRNPASVTRTSETIVLDAEQLRGMLGLKDVRRVHVRDEASGKELLIQAVDTDDDGTFEELIFQTDLAPGETRKFVLSTGERQVPRREDFKAYGRFVRERRDDFAWENDRIAHRMYGAALETWAQEPLTSSAVDVWTKRGPGLVIDAWYMVDDYHRDHGQGGDFYSAGPSRGCGGSGIWSGGRLYPSANFRGSRVLANGPIRVIFELTYESWDAGGVRVSEVKRITLDAGHQFSRFESRYRVVAGDPQTLTYAVGIKKGLGTASSTLREQGALRTWESLKENGQLGCAIIIDPANVLSFTEDKANFLITGKALPGNTAVYYAGFGWSKAHFPTVEDWDRHVENYATRLKPPVQVTLSAQ